ncbi:MAG: DUF2325 domain-containing protein [Campylobacteraceae bacterium]
MSVLVIGADDILTIKNTLSPVGVEKFYHIDGRRNSDTKKEIPCDTHCVILLTNFINHNAMKVFKKQAKAKNIPLICSKKNVNCIFAEYCKLFKE